MTHHDHTWSYRDDSYSSVDLVGYSVEASDGSIGKIDKTSNETSSSYVVVDTGFWIFGKKRLIPAGAITTIDHNDKQVHVAMTKDQIKSAPDFDESDWNDDSRSRHGDYYADYSRRDV